MDSAGSVEVVDSVGFDAASDFPVVDFAGFDFTAFDFTLPSVLRAHAASLDCRARRLRGSKENTRRTFQLPSSCCW